MNNSKIMLVFLSVIFFVSAIWVNETAAIPAFARRHKISCTTCHAPFPKLKPYGAEFAGNGFIMKEDEKARDYISAGDDLLWLNKDFPVGVRFDAYAIYESNHPVELDLQSPWGLKLMSGGTLYKNIGYYFYFYMSERGEVAGVEDAYVHFDNIFGSNLDVMVGQFQTSDPLMKRELRLTFEDYMIYKTSVGSSRTDLAYDRGVMLVYGIEKTGTDLVGLVVNGNGKAEAGSDKKFDDDGYQNFGFRIIQGIGDFMSVGGYYYSGREKRLIQSIYPVDPKNEITYFGPDLNLTVSKFELTAQYLVRKDTNPFFLDPTIADLAGDLEHETTGIVAELIFSPQLDRSRFYFTGLYNKIDSDLEKYETATLSGTFLVARNLRLIGEYTRDLEYEQNRVTFGLVSGF